MRVGGRMRGYRPQTSSCSAVLVLDDVDRLPPPPLESMHPDVVRSPAYEGGGHLHCAVGPRPGDDLLDLTRGLGSGTQRAA